MNWQEYLKNSLNPAQLEAVETTSGPLLVLAGAGSGKTRVLTFRVANLISQGEAAPNEILAVTFTNKAAREMEHRILDLLQNLGIPVMDSPWVSTFHSTCARILREHIHLLDYQPFFVIYDDSDQLSMIKKVLHALNIDEKMHPAKSFKSLINEAKTLGLGPQEIESQAQYLMDDRGLQVYTMYETEMKRANALDFGDLLLKTYDLFRMYPDILELYQNKFRYILIDEYQDTNQLQYKLVNLLAAQFRNLCVVGDEDQSIYSWRGADISNILDFEKDFPEAKTVKLEENYRSTNTIVASATKLIQNNTQRKNKELFTSNPDGDKITVREESSEYNEARYVVNRIKHHIDDGTLNYNDFAIFYRTNAQSRVFEDQLRSNGIPYRIVGGLKFYDRMEVKDILAYLKLSLNANDDVALKRIINTPTRGIGKTTIEKLENFSNQQQVSMLEACRMASEHKIVHAGATKKLLNFYSLIERIQTAKENSKLSDLYLTVLDETQYVRKLKEENTTESLARVDNLEEFNNAILQFEQERGEEASLQNFLEEMALVSDIDNVEESDMCVTLMTLHISKGLEYPVVFMVGMEEGLFPSAMKFESIDPDDLEEERRLAYVGITRARQTLYMTYARSRKVWGQEHNYPPSRFIKELPQNYIHFESSIPKPSSSRPKFMSRYDSASKSSSYDSFESDFDQMPDYEGFDDSENESYQKGMKVRHPTFGVGSIFKIEGRGENQKVSVMFGNRMTKKFVVKYARLERL